MPLFSSCLFCGAKVTSDRNKCAECESLKSILEEVYSDAKNQLSNNASVERETVFKTMRELAFVVQEDALLRTYKNTIQFLLRQFLDSDLPETTLETYTKKVPTRLNHLKILNELSNGGLIDWDSSRISTDSIPKIHLGPAFRNLKTMYNRTTGANLAEQRFGHAVAFFAVLPLLIAYSACSSRDEIKALNVIPKKPWVILLVLLVANQDGKISLERTSRFLRRRRGIGNVYGTILTNLISLSADHVQKATIGREESDNGDRLYIISPEITKYFNRVRENIRSR